MVDENPLEVNCTISIKGDADKVIVDIGHPLNHGAQSRDYETKLAKKWNLQAVISSHGSVRPFQGLSVQGGFGGFVFQGRCCKGSSAAATRRPSSDNRLYVVQAFHCNFSRVSKTMTATEEGPLPSP